MDEKSLEESAKATQEIAKATGKGIELADKVAGFVANYIGGTLEQGFGIFEDKLKYYRANNQLRYIEKFNQTAEDMNLKPYMGPVALKLAIPLLEASSLEDDEYLQNLWVNLLINASNKESNILLQRSQITVLEQLSSFEARTLETIYSFDTTGKELNGVTTDKLPFSANLVSERDISNSKIDPKDPDDNVKLALANLARLRLVSLPLVFGGGEVFKYVNQTLFGRHFVEACTLDVSKESRGQVP